MSLLWIKNLPFPLLLASTSPYRKIQLASLGYTFETCAPLFDEEKAKRRPLNPKQLSLWLAKNKAHSLKEKFSDHIILGGDQVCCMNQRVFHKPLTFDRAYHQLKQMQGKKHTLHTALSLYFRGKSITKVVSTHLFMRPMNKPEIEHYLNLDKPFDCAGSYKYEEHGHKLFSKIQTTDPSSIIGLPLLTLQTMLLQLAKRT